LDVRAEEVDEVSDAAGIVFLIGRILFVVFFLISGLGFHVAKSAQAEGYARQMGFPLPGIAGWPTGIWMTVAALSIALGIWPDIGALMLCAFAIIAALYFHRFWATEDESQKQTQQQLFFRNMIIVGGGLSFFAFFASAGPGLRFSITEALITF
jgi:putative oxidoreductase